MGLPGETIDIRNGDIYVDGKIARKPDRVQDELWRPIQESMYVERDGGGTRGAAWRAEGGTWTAIDEGKGWKGECRPGGGASQDATGWLVYNREIRDWNRSEERRVGKECRL